MGCSQSVSQEDQDAAAADAGAAPLINDIMTQQSAPGLAVSLDGTVLVSTMHREGSNPNGRVFEYANGALQEIIAGIESAQGTPGLAIMPDGTLLVSTFSYQTRRASILQFASTSSGQTPADAHVYMSDIECYNGPPDLAARPDGTLLIAAQSQYGPPRSSVYSFAPGATSWAEGTVVIDGTGSGVDAFPSPGGAPSIALKPDGAILLATKNHPGSECQVYEFHPGATTGADAKAIASGLITQSASPGLAVKSDGTMLISTVITAAC